MPTIRHIAQLAGVSTSTVSLALRNSTRISAAMRARIHEIARQVHYQPPQPGVPAAPRERTPVLGCILPYVSFPIVPRVLSGILHAAYEHRCRLIPLESAWFRMDDLSSALHALFAQHVDGVVITGVPFMIPRRLLLEIESREVMPVLALCRGSEIPVDTVTIHEGQTATLLLDHLLQRGHRCLAYVESSRESIYTFRAPLTEMATRRNVILHTIDAASVPADAEGILQRIRQFHPSPTAILCQRDEEALRLLRECHRYGVRVPEDVAIVGCGNYHGSDLTTPALTSIDVYPEVIGRHAVHRLMDRLSGTIARDAAAMRETVPVQLMQRESTHAVAATPPRAPLSRLVPPVDPPGSRADAILAALRDGFITSRLYCTDRAGHPPTHPEFWGWHSTDEHPEWHPHPDAVHIGSVDQDWIYLDPARTQAYLKSQRSELTHHTTFSMHSMLRALEDTGFLQVQYSERQRHRTLMMRHGDTTKRMIVLRREALYGV